MSRDMELEIRAADNGYSVSHWEESEDLETVKHTYVVEDSCDSRDSELDAMKKLLLYVKEFFGVIFSDHNEKNIVIEIRKNEDVQWRESLDGAEIINDSDE